MLALKKRIKSDMFASQSKQFFNYQIQLLELIIYEYMSLYQVLLLILELFPARLAITTLWA